MYKYREVSFAAMYTLLRAFLFLFDPEKVHYFSMNILKMFCGIKPLQVLISKLYTPAGDITNLAGLSFRNKVGLGAGFDKNAIFLRELEALGFGFVEIGTVTPLAQEGNPKPRLFRLKKDQALINRMGFNNDGADAIAKRLKDWRAGHPETKLIIGGNIGKNKITDNAVAWNDYVTCFEKLAPYVDYFVVNVSSPNTPGLRALQDKDALRVIFRKLKEKRISMGVIKPIFLKIAPDLSEAELDDVVDLAVEISLEGIVAFNTTLDRSSLSAEGKSQAETAGAGGLSGKPIRGISSFKFKYLSEKAKGRIPLIASGGIFSREDAEQRLNDGASLIQVWTGFIYEGPSICKRICGYLAKQA